MSGRTQETCANEAKKTGGNEHVDRFLANIVVENSQSTRRAIFRRFSSCPVLPWSGLVFWGPPLLPCERSALIAGMDESFSSLSLQRPSPIARFWEQATVCRDRGIISGLIDVARCV